MLFKGKYLFPKTRLYFMFMNAVILLFFIFPKYALSQEKITMGLPPLLAPNEEDLARGKYILEKVSNIVRNGDLWMGEDVMREFGFKQNNHKLTDAEIGRETLRPISYKFESEDGFSTDVQIFESFVFERILKPVESSKRNYPVAEFRARFYPGSPQKGLYSKSKACITVEMLQENFYTWRDYEIEINPLIIETHPVLRPPRVHDIASVYIKQSQIFNNKGFFFLVFNFDYQRCASMFRVALH